MARSPRTTPNRRAATSDSVRTVAARSSLSKGGCASDSAMNVTYERRKRERLCVICERPVTSPFVRCDHCLAHNRAYLGTPERKAWYLARDRSPKRRAWRRAHERQRRKDAKIRARILAQQRIRSRAFNRSPKRLAWLRKYRKNESVLARERARMHRRRASIRGDAGGWTPAQFEALCAKYNYRCLACGRRRRLTPDHVIPIAKWPEGKAGVNRISNIQPLCKPCNHSKNSHHSTDYRKNPHPNCGVKRKVGHAKVVSR